MFLYRLYLKYFRNLAEKADLGRLALTDDIEVAFNANTTQNYVGSRSFIRETQITSSILGNLLDVVEEWMGRTKRKALLATLDKIKEGSVIGGTNDSQKSVFDLVDFAGDLTVEENTNRVSACSTKLKQRALKDQVWTHQSSFNLHPHSDNGAGTLLKDPGADYGDYSNP
ncbi:hypothetical protein LOK49_LG10G01824 [Camellia lanceoleosa]|uniref:Uncharacterized protein n=1 Tax=Camellia lanceoleosa TaxID=1840588 RepID=A0ACC0G9X8_9ERIC|nr:hypothetical protein LOK49_LG10G01824 [Camellia lanceoleosa]